MFLKKRDDKKEDLLLFLDIDGVLNTDNTFSTKYKLLDKNLDALAMLSEKLSGAGYRMRVILSSTWRYGYESDYSRCSPQVQRLLTELERRGVQVTGKTPVYKEASRDMEIMRYIKEYMLKNAGFKCLTLDDDGTIFNKENMGRINLYRVNQHTGLTQGDIAGILKQVKDWKYVE